MEYANIEALSNDFVEARLTDLPEIISVGGLQYRSLKGSAYPLDTMISNSLKGIILYSLLKNPENVEKFKQIHKNAEESQVQDRVAFIWAFNRLRLNPVAVKYMSKARSEPIFQSGLVREAEIQDERIVNTNVPIILSGFNNGEQISAKVDTGAHISSLHAEDVKVMQGKGLVSFVFGSKRYTMPALETQAIQTADNGVENRPVVAFDVILLNKDADTRNKVLKKIKFNLNDRSSMPDKILLGQNFIKAGDFVVVNDGEGISEEVEWEEVQDDVKDIDISHLEENIDNKHKILDDIVDNVKRLR